MQALKGLVIVLGGLIVLAMGAIAYGLMQKADDPSFSFFPQGEETATAQIPAAPSAAPAKLAPFGEIPLVLPEGCRLMDMRPDGPRLFLRLGGPGCERVVAVDLASGRVLGAVTLGRAP